MHDSEGNNDNHSKWIEIYNTTDKKLSLEKATFGFIDTKDLKLGSDQKHYTGCHAIKNDIDIGSKSFIVIAEDIDKFYSDYPSLKDAGLTVDSSFSLSSKENYIRLSNDKCETFFYEISYDPSWGGKDNGKTIEKISLEKNDTEDNWQESYVLGGTPGEKNSQKAEEPVPPEPKDDTDFSGLIINEIFPSPDTSAGEKEFIEIKNTGDKKINIKDLIATDSSHDGKPVGSDIFIEPGKLYALEGTFYLNSPSDTVRLLDKNKLPIDTVPYDNAQSKHSYSFDGSSWRWTSKITPNDENDFDKLLSAKIEKDKEIYTNIYANFEAKTDKDAQKFTWDFGDGHKSYLQKTKHKYAASGEYAASLKITGSGEASTQYFTVTVNDYDAPNIKITAINPNPKGSDTKNETITLANKSKKKINLLGWSIATGWKTLYNHPIRQDFILKAGKTKILTKKFCAFTLNNTQAKIELRDPTGHVVQKLKYDRTKNKIVEDETLEISGKKLAWNKPPDAAKENPTKTTGTKNSDTAPSSSENNSADNDIIIAPQSEIEANIGKYTNNPDWKDKKQNQLKLLSYDSHIKTPEIILANSPKVLGISTEKFSPPEKHWAITLWDNLWLKINSGVNWVLNKI